MAFLNSILLLIQKGSIIPNPKDSKPNQEFGNYTFLDFISNNWFWLVSIAVLIILVVFYLKEKKRLEKKEAQEREKSKWN